MSIFDFVRSLVERNGKLPIGVDVGSFDFRSSGHVDSLGIVRFVLDIEAFYGISFSDSELASPAFRTINGVVRLIMVKVKS